MEGFLRFSKLSVIYESSNDGMLPDLHNKFIALGRGSGSFSIFEIQDSMLGTTGFGFRVYKNCCRSSMFMRILLCHSWSSIVY
jgi:hypothetical protein